MSLRDNRIQDLRSRLTALLDELDAAASKQIKFHQQLVHKFNMCFTGGNGSIWIQPTSSGYDISLSGKSLEKQMTPFMESLSGRKCDGYKQKNQRLGKLDNPFWRVSDFELVRQAVLHYAKSGK